ncbi:MAG TPA: RNA polymerase sigma factor [Polyangiaceae bacterium]|nr:RNA polymerase sigma factor [Polyangiaceae bacterium]
MATGTLDSRALTPQAAPGEHAVRAPGIQEVYAEHFRYVWRCLRSLGVRDAVLDDALQDVFLVVQRKLASFEGKSELRTWLYAIALRVARRYRTRPKEEPGPEADGEHAAIDAEACANLEASVECNQRLELARRALDALHDHKREVFVLAQIEQMSAPEIAEITGLPLNTVYSRLRAARLAFSAEVRRLEELPKRLP